MFIFVFAFWTIDVYIFDQHVPRLLAKLGKCSHCNSKSTKFFDWDESIKGFRYLINPVGEWSYLTGKFKVKCEKCKEIYEANYKTRAFFFFLEINSLILPIFIYGFILLPFVGFDKVDVTKAPLLLFPLLALILIHVYFRLNKKFY